MATKQTNIRIEKELLDRYEALGAANDRTGSYYIRKAVESFELVQDKPKVVAKIKKEVAVKSYVESPKPLKMKSDSDEVIDYLNLRAGTKYRYSKASRDCIEPRLKEFSIDDCKAVIDKKCDEWLNTENAKYLRPETLFRVSKFEGYLNQIVVIGGGQNGQPRKQSLTERTTATAEQIFSQLEAGGDDYGSLGQDDTPLRLQVDQQGR